MFWPPSVVALTEPVHNACTALPYDDGRTVSTSGIELNLAPNTVFDNIFSTKKLNYKTQI